MQLGQTDLGQEEPGGGKEQGDESSFRDQAELLLRSARGPLARGGQVGVGGNELLELLEFFSCHGAYHPCGWLLLNPFVHPVQSG